MDEFVKPKENSTQDNDTLKFNLAVDDTTPRIKMKIEVSNALHNGRSKKALKLTMLKNDVPPFTTESSITESGSIRIIIRPPELCLQPLMQPPEANNNDTTSIALPNKNAVSKLATESNVLNSSSNLFPGLTDDMFVATPPSFVVPFLYENPPKTTLRAVVEKLWSDFKLDDIKENEDGLLKDLTALKDMPISTIESKRDDQNKDSGGIFEVIINKAVADDVNIIKSAITSPAKIVFKNKKLRNYFESPMGTFFIDLGTSLVQEYVQADLLKIQKRKRKAIPDTDIKSCELVMNVLQKKLDVTKKVNKPFKFVMKRCEFCQFTTESHLVMANHYETPHVIENFYQCNFCLFQVLICYGHKSGQEILCHMATAHKVKGYLPRPLKSYECSNCPFSNNHQWQYEKHKLQCAKNFCPEKNLCPPAVWDAPAKIPNTKRRKK